MKESFPSLLFAFALLGNVTAAAQEAVSQQPIASTANPPSGSVAQSADAAAVATRPLADQLLADGIAQLDERKSIAARVRHRTLWFGQRLIGSGRYLQGPPEQHLVRLELRTPLVDKVSTLQHVCDGRTLWIYEYSNAGKNLGRIDVSQATSAMKSAPPRGGSPTALLAVGGLPQLLRNLDGRFEFMAADRRMLGDLPCWVLRGAWEKQQLAAMLPDQKADIEAGKQPNLASLPPQLPDQVVVWLGRDDLFPYRIEFRRAVPAEFMQKRNGLIDNRESSMVFEFFEVQFDAMIDPKEFTYDPGPLFAEDRTAGFMKTLGLQ